MSDGLADAYKKKDVVNHPDHYTSGGIEVIDYMKAKMSEEQFEGYLLGNIIKYTSRYQQKNGVEDLLKAEWYIKKLVAEKKAERDEKAQKKHEFYEQRKEKLFIDTPNFPEVEDDERG
jgi:hypothetical protein